jgi:hypothetical protein
MVDARAHIDMMKEGKEDSKVTERGASRACNRL